MVCYKMIERKLQLNIKLHIHRVRRIAWGGGLEGGELDQSFSYDVIVPAQVGPCAHEAHWARIALGERQCVRKHPYRP